MLVQNYTDLTLESMVLDGTGLLGTAPYTLSNNNGSIVIDRTAIRAKTGGVAFDVCRYASYPSVSVTVKEGSSIEGNIEVDAAGGNAMSGMHLMLEGGAFTGQILLTAGARTAMQGDPDTASVKKVTESVEVGIPSDYKWEEISETVSRLVPKDYVAKIETTGAKYETLEEAIAAAEDGDTVTVLKDCAGNGIKAPQGRFDAQGLTVDFGGFTYTMDGSMVGSAGTQTQAFQLLKGNKITFKNGTLASQKAYMLVQNYSDLTLEGMTLELDNADYAPAYTLSNNNGNVVIQDTTINANPAGGFAFDVCRYSSYPSVHVTVKGESVINGNIEVYASENDAKDGSGLMLESGTFTGKIVLDPTAMNAMDISPEKAKVIRSKGVEIGIPDDYAWEDYDDAHDILRTGYAAKNLTTGVRYGTLAGALGEAVSGQTVVPLRDITDEPFILAMDGVTLDLNGHKVTGATLLYVTGTLKDSGDVRGEFSADAYYLGRSVNSEFPIYDETKDTYSLYDLSVLTWAPPVTDRHGFGLAATAETEEAGRKILESAVDGRVSA